MSSNDCKNLLKELAPDNSWPLDSKWKRQSKRKDGEVSIREFENQYGQKLIYIGERGGGCTANDKFFNSLENNTYLDQNMTDKLQKNSLSFTGLHDDWYVYEIN